MTEILIIGLAILILWPLDLLTVAAQASLMYASRLRLQALDDQPDPTIPRIIALLEDQPRARACLRLALVIWRVLLIGSVLLLLAESLLKSGPALIFLALLLAGLVLWLSEVLVEGLVAHQPETWALRLSPFSRFLVLLLSPLAALQLALLGESRDQAIQPGAVTEDELMTLVDASQREGVLEQEEREMIFSIFRFGDTLAREIMVPRIDVLALSIDTPFPQAVDALLESGYSRVPVYEGTIDNIRGLIYVKDLLQAWRDSDQGTPLKGILRPGYFIPETKKLDELLEEMQAGRIHMAIVVDEYGGMAGLVTLEDIVEEIIGEIRDEYDQGEELLYQQVGEEEYVFHGRIDLDDFNLFMHSHLSNDDADTLGGYIYSQIGRVPKGGESLQADDILLIVEQVIGRRIRRVRAQRNLAADENKAAGNAAL